MQSDTGPNTAHCAGVDADRTSKPTKQPTTAHPTSTPVHHSADAVAANNEADHDLPVVVGRGCGTVVLLQLGPEPALGCNPPGCLGDRRFAGLVDAVEGLGHVGEVQPRQGLVGRDTASPERTWAYADRA